MLEKELDLAASDIKYFSPVISVILNYCRRIIQMNDNPVVELVL